MGTVRSGAGRAASRGPSSVAVVLCLEALAVVLFVAFVVVVQRGGARDTSGGGFFDDPLPAALVLLAATAAVAAGVLATVSLVRDPLRSRAGRWAMWLALLSALMFPAVAASVTAVAWLVGYDLPDGWGDPIAPFWLLTALAATVLGVRANEPGRRGLLILPVVIGAFVLTFWLGEILAPH